MARTLTEQQKQKVADLPRDARDKVEMLVKAGYLQRLTLREIIDRAYAILSYEADKRIEAFWVAEGERREKEKANAN